MKEKYKNKKIWNCWWNEWNKGIRRHCVTNLRGGCRGRNGF